MDVEDKFSGDYVTSEALKDNAELCKPLEVVDVILEEVGKEERVVIAFKGVEKTLVVNHTNFKVIKEQLGSETDNWIGAKITLAVKDALFNNKKVDSVRIVKVEV